MVDLDRMSYVWFVEIGKSPSKSQDYLGYPYV